MAAAVAGGRGFQEELGEMLARHLAAADLLGRAQVVRTAHKRTGRVVEIGQRTSRFRFDDSQDDISDGAEDLAAGVGAFPVSFDAALPNDDIASYLRGLTPVTKDLFDGLTANYRKDAFTLAGVADVRLIEKIRDALADVAQKGGTAADFDKAAQQLLTDAGVEDLNAFTLDTAFNTAMQRAFARGRYDQMKEPAVKAILPIWQYWTVGDDRVRPEHRVLHGFAALADDPVWLKIYPPNGFNCRCSVVPILASDLDAKALEATRTPGMQRLPLLAVLKVPQPGFGKVFAA